jgi:hypothetical protein
MMLLRRMLLGLKKVNSVTVAQQQRAEPSLSASLAWRGRAEGSTLRAATEAGEVAQIAVTPKLACDAISRIREARSTPWQSSQRPFRP